MNEAGARRSLPLAALLIGLVLAGSGFLTGESAFAQYPTRPLRIIVPVAPGGSTDALTRIMAPRMTEILGQQIVVDNRAGAASQIGTDLVAKSPPNGYTILHVDTVFASNPSLFSKLPYDALRDFAPVSMLATAPVALVIHPSVPARTLKELTALGKSQPKLFSFATGALGGATHLAMLQFKAATRIDLVEISYKSGGLATIDVLAGQVPMMIAGPSSLAQHVASGKLRAIAVTGDKRISAMPDTPTFAEGGLKEVDAYSFFGSFVPAATPAEIVRTLNATTVKVLQMPDVRKRLLDLGIDTAGTTPAEFGVKIRSEMAKWSKAAKEGSISVQ